MITPYEIITNDFFVILDFVGINGIIGLEALKDPGDRPRLQCSVSSKLNHRLFPQGPAPGCTGHREVGYGIPNVPTVCFMHKRRDVSVRGKVSDSS